MTETKLIDALGGLIDEFIKENEINMLIRLPKDSDIPEIKDNTGGGAVMQFYIIINTLPIVLKEMVKTVGEIDKRPMLEDICRLLIDEVMESEE